MLVRSLPFLLLAVIAPAQQPDREPESAPDWSMYLGAEARLPEAEALPGLLDRLVTMLGDPDPERRDDIGYALLARWTLREKIVGDDLLRALLDRLTHGLDAGDEDGGVLRRSFSMLCLSLLAKRDLESPWLEPHEFDALVARALRFLAEERDLRGYDAELGWVHCVAHTADVLKFAARSERLSDQQQAAIVDGVCARIETAPATFAAGEDLRLASALLSLCAREDFDAAGFEERIGELVRLRCERPTEQIALMQNRRHLLVTLYAMLDFDDRELAGIAAARATIREALGA
jgi:hypothetical protein